MRCLAVFNSNIHGKKREQNRLEKASEKQKIKVGDFYRIERALENTGFSRVPLAGRMGFEPMCDCSQTDFEFCVAQVFL